MRPSDAATAETAAGGAYIQMVARAGNRPARRRPEANP